MQTSNSTLIHWVAAGLLAAFGALAIFVIGYDEIAGRQLDTTALYLLTFIAGAITSILSLSTGVQLGQKSAQQASTEMVQTLVEKGSNGNGGQANARNP